MTEDVGRHSKIDLAGARVAIPIAAAQALSTAILTAAGCDPHTAALVAEHLVDADLCGVESHGFVRTLQYVEQIESGYLKPKAQARLCHDGRGNEQVDGGGGLGIPAMQMALDRVCTLAETQALAALPVRAVGHTGRLGAYAESGALRGCLVMIIGGGGRQTWRQVAPFGGRKALLPTNPYCMAIPGGDAGPVVVDFATSMIAGGWLYSARAAGALVPPDTVIDADGRPTRDPNDYFAGGAILPKGGPMGYGLAVMAEMICEAMLGPVEAECNWLILAMKTSRFRDETERQAVAEEILSELRACPPAEGFTDVEIPGERERRRRTAQRERGLMIPGDTLQKIRDLADRYGVVRTMSA